MAFTSINSKTVAIILTVLGGAASFGGTVAIAKMKQADTDAKIAEQDARTTRLEQAKQEDHDRLIRMEVLLGDTSKAVDRIEKRIEKKLDGP